MAEPAPRVRPAALAGSVRDFDGPAQVRTGMTQARFAGLAGDDLLLVRAGNSRA
ncbi:MAG: hypothetical protein V2J10_07705 [Wenzhouxiangella sp.]|jgi:hypothetical protein|nr:hypothetical protein [Wenzhouxiangella sp.]